MIRLSLRKKICLILSAFTIVFSLLLMIAVGMGFTPFYFHYKKDTLVSMSQVIASLYEKGEANYVDEFDQISQQGGAAVFIVDKGTLVYSSRPDRKAVVGKPHFDSENVVTAEAPQRTEDTKTEDFKTPRHVELMRKLFNGEKLPQSDLRRVFFDGDEDHVRFMSILWPSGNDAYVIVTQPMEPMEATVAVVQQFVIICSLIWLVIAIIGAIFCTNRLTRPLLKLKQLSVAMAHLDFSKKWTDTRSDEIGELGRSLNELSTQLDTALNELKQANNELEVQLQKANEIEEMRKAFISAVSHELKTPLALIQGYAEGLDSLDISEETRKRYCRVIHSETEKMDHLVKDLLNLSRLETGSFRIEMTEFDFPALAEELRYRFDGVIKDKQINITSHFPDAMEVYGDPERIDTVMSNLLSNAIDYTGIGKKIDVSAVREGDHYVISIYNQGIQIAAADQSRIWEPFYKVDAARTRQPQRVFGGHGLGLGIVAALVERHGQKYGVRNETDGVTFWFTLAAAK